jgi:hypothetical protein
MSTHHHPAGARATAKVSVVVSDVAGVQRILTMLTGRNCPMTRFEAEEAGNGRWRLGIDCVVDAPGADLLEARLHRIPSVLTVRLRRGGHLAAAG